MELKRERIEKSLNWLDSLVGNSNDSDIALFTYQLLGILYDTCEELTGENERLKCEISDLKDELKCEKETNAHLCSQYMSENHLRHQAEEMLANGMSVVKADTVRKMQERLNAHFDSDSDYFRSSHGYIRSVVDQIAKEMLEGKL